jgi:uncharacterized protein (DUF433 family)
MPATVSVIHSDPDVLGGVPVFVGTRVPVRTLLDYLEAGEPLAEFLEDFPTVSREQAIAVLRLAREALTAHARSQSLFRKLPSPLHSGERGRG